MRFNLKNLLLAFPFWGIAAATAAEQVRVVAQTKEMAAKGIFVCGFGNYRPEAAALLFIAGVAMAGGYRRAAVIMAIPALLWLSQVWLTTSGF